MNGNQQYLKSFELVFPRSENPGTYTSVLILIKNIIRSPVLYQKYVQDNETKYVFKFDCEDENVIKYIFGQGKNSEISKKQNFYVNEFNKEFLSKLGEGLKIKQVITRVDDFDKDESFFKNDQYCVYKKIQKALLFHRKKAGKPKDYDEYDEKKSDEQILLEYISEFNNFKISNNLLSLKNRMNILKSIVDLPKNALFEGKIGEKLKNEIKKFQDEIDSIPSRKVNGHTIYDSFIDKIRFDELKQLQQEINKTPNYDFEKKYTFKYDFTNLIPNQATILDICVYFNAYNCYSYIVASYVKQLDLSKPDKKAFMENLPKFAFASGNEDMINFCNQNQLFKKDDYQTYFDIAIAYQNNFLFDYLTETFGVRIVSDRLAELIGISNNIGILKKLVSFLGVNLNKALFTAFDYDNLLLLDILSCLRSSEINNGIDILYFTVFGV